MIHLMHKSFLLKSLTLIVTFLLIATSSVATAQTRLKDICRVKGQEENTLQGIGLIVGLSGTGDSAASKSTINALVTAMRFMGSPVDPKSLTDPKNIAIVIVRATVPAAGGRQGDQLDCVVSSIGDATSLAGGQLIPTPLLGPRSTADQVFAFATGKVTTPDVQVATGGKIKDGCRLEEDFFNPFVKDGKITLILDKNKATFQVAQNVVDVLNTSQSGESDVTEDKLAQAIDQLNIEVTIPKAYVDDPVFFVSTLMETSIQSPETEARVVINRAAGTIVVTGDTTIGAAIVSHKNIGVETGGDYTDDRFIGIEAPERAGPRLAALVKALQAVHVPAEDVADILLALSRSGKLHARVIVE